VAKSIVRLSRLVLKVVLVSHFLKSFDLFVFITRAAAQSIN